MQLSLQDRTSLERVVNGALRSAIDTHGPINRHNYSSASKRIIGALKSYADSEPDIAKAKLRKREKN